MDPIIILGIVAAILAALALYFYTKSLSLQKELDETKDALSRCETNLENCVDLTGGSAPKRVPLSDLLSHKLEKADQTTIYSTLTKDNLKYFLSVPGWDTLLLSRALIPNPINPTFQTRCNYISLLTGSIILENNGYPISSGGDNYPIFAEHDKCPTNCKNILGQPISGEIVQIHNEI